MKTKNKIIALSIAASVAGAMAAYNAKAQVNDAEPVRSVTHTSAPRPPVGGSATYDKNKANVKETDFNSANATNSESDFIEIEHE